MEDAAIAVTIDTIAINTILILFCFNSITSPLTFLEGVSRGSPKGVNFGVCDYLHALPGAFLSGFCAVSQWGPLGCLRPATCAKNHLGLELF